MVAELELSEEERRHGPTVLVADADEATPAGNKPPVSMDIDLSDLVLDHCDSQSD